MSTRPAPAHPEPAAGSLTLTLPLPPKALWPNARPNRYAKAKATREYRRMAWAYAMAERQMGNPYLWKRAKTRVTFYFATDRRRDMDSCSASLKAAWDGIADAGIVVNDSGFTHHPPVLELDHARPRVEITVTEVRHG